MVHVEESGGNMIRNVIGILAVIMVFLLIGMPETKASENVDYYLTVGESTVTNEESQLQINQSTDQITFSILQDGETQIKGTNAQMVMEHATFTSINEQPSLLIFLRETSLENALIFKQFEIVDGIWTETFVSKAYPHATYNIEDGMINLTYTDVSTDKDTMNQHNYDIATKVSETPRNGMLKSNTNNDMGEDAVINNILIEEIGTNPTDAQLNEIFTSEAQKLGIPAEIVKAIAYQEGAWAQYWPLSSIPITHYTNNCTPEKAAEKNGSILAWDQTNVKLGYDCIGIGVMQVSDWRYKKSEEKDAYIQRLKEDVRFNISEGLKTLKEKWDFSKSGTIPTVNDNNPNYIDNWYFAILAYNGLLERNNPQTNAKAYQETITKHMNNQGLLSISPFPTDQIETTLKDGYLLRFPTKLIETPHTLTLSKQEIPVGSFAYSTQNGVNIRSKTNISTTIGSLAKGQRVKVLGNVNKEHSTYRILYPNSRENHYYFLPVQLDNGTVAYVASSYIMPEKKVNVLNLSGQTRYDTSARISNAGWHNDLAQTVVLGRGDVPIDALTGSVLAAQKGAPILLTESAKLTAPIAKELSRLKPQTIYILGGESAISAEVETTLAAIYPKVIRLKGASRYDTARVVGNEIASTQSMSEIFIASGSETSPDALAIAPVAGMKKVPILLQSGSKLRNETKLFIQQHSIKKVTLIGGELALPKELVSQLKDLGIATENIQRVSGKDRYLTATAIASKYFTNPDGLFFARGDQIVDALSGSSLASKWNQPILLTKSTSVPQNVQLYIKQVNPAPSVNYLGGFMAINEQTRRHIEELVWQ